MHEILPNNR